MEPISSIISATVSGVLANVISQKVESATNCEIPRLLDKPITVQVVNVISPELCTSPRPRATLNDVRFMMNEIRDDELGMEIAIDFSLGDLQGCDCGVEAYLFFQNGEPLKDFNGKYRTVNNCVSVRSTVTPSRKEENFEDVRLFLPYHELHLSSGEHLLKIKLRVYQFVGNVTLVQSADFHWAFCERPLEFGGVITVGESLLFD